MAGKDPYMPNMLRMMTGNGTAYVAPILPVKVMTTLHMANPKNTMGMVSLAVKPKAITLLTVAASGGANMSLHQYFYRVSMCVTCRRYNRMRTAQ